jgi:hypothetical protein
VNEDRRWTPTSEGTPPNKSEVIAIAPSGDERPLYFENGLWFLPDRSMYVYFVPTFWRPKESQ